MFRALANNTTRQLSSTTALKNAAPAQKLVTLTINGKTVQVPPGTTVIRAAEEIGVQIPRFCYHERLSIAGNCRMCLVDMVGGPKPVIACAYPVMEGMTILTESERAKKAREGVMEFLLINHPLDCPVCDQGGECDLQDQAYAFGSDRTRFEEEKRAVADKDIGPLVKTVMTRCIQCTRCVRFSHEIAGNPCLGLSGRGTDASIGTYKDIQGMIATELSGNLIDVCPVGALTSKPYAFQGRPWENRKHETVDCLDAVGAAIQVSSRAGDLLRIMPKINDDINEEWIGDRSRFSYDGLKRQRLTQPLIKQNGRFVPTHWEDALESVAAALAAHSGSEVAAVAGAQCDGESLVALKDFLQATVDSEQVFTEEAFPADSGDRANYLFNSTIVGLEEADLVLIIGANPRYEATSINTRLRKTWFHNDTDVAFVGPTGLDFSYATDELGDSADTIESLIDGSHPYAARIAEAKNAMIVLGSGAVQGEEGAIVHAQAKALAAKYGAQFNFMHKKAAQVGALDLGYNSTGQKEALSTAKFVINMGADEGVFEKQPGQFVVYMGTHGDDGAKNADIILPGAAYTEKHGTFVNTEGRSQQARPVVHPPGAARVQWQIIRALSETVAKVSGENTTLPYDTLEEVRERMETLCPTMVQYDHLETSPYVPESSEFEGKLTEKFDVEQKDLSDYYMTCPITRASKNMANAVKSAKEVVPEEQFIAES